MYGEDSPSTSLLLNVELALVSRSASPASASCPLYSSPDLSSAASVSVPLRSIEGKVVPGCSGRGAHELVVFPRGLLHERQQLRHDVALALRDRQDLDRGQARLPVTTVVRSFVERTGMRAS